VRLELLAWLLEWDRATASGWQHLGEQQHASKVSCSWLEDWGFLKQHKGWQGWSFTSLVYQLRLRSP